jgi:hypothetical protein
MRPFELVDSLYEEFCRSLRGPLADSAHALAFTLKLAPERGIPWSRIFSHEVTLAAPMLVAEGIPDAGETSVAAAVCAHMLAVVEAFGTDRIADRQVIATPELVAVLAAMRDARDRALVRVGEAHGATYVAADLRTRASIAQEGEILESGRSVSFAEYEAVSFGKQAVGFPATEALLAASRCSVRTRRSATSLLTGVWLGLQMGDDVVDWEEDAARGGAWAVALAGGPQHAGPSTVRARVFAAGVLSKMLARASSHFRGVRRRAAAVGARKLEIWGREREAYIEHLLASEREAPGYARRAHALGAWAAEVLG